MRMRGMTASPPTCSRDVPGGAGMGLRRRGFLAGAAALVLLPVPAAAVTLAPDVAAALEAILDGRTPVEGGIVIDAPAVADNGAQVPVTISVDSPMTEADHVTAIHILATLNPAPGIARFHLTPHLTRAEVAWAAVGTAIGAYEAALAYAKERVQFGKPIASRMMPE